MEPIHREGAPRRSPTVGGIVAAVGGVLVIAGTWFELVRVTVGRGATQVSVSKSYFDTDHGKVVIALGVVVLVVALSSLLKPDLGVIVPVVIAVAGLAAFGFALYDRIDLKDASDAVGATFGPALYIVMGGGLVSTIGALFVARDD
jgi:hypothetical protein